MTVRMYIREIYIFHFYFCWHSFILIKIRKECLLSTKSNLRFCSGPECNLRNIYIVKGTRNKLYGWAANLLSNSWIFTASHTIFEKFAWSEQRPRWGSSTAWEHLLWHARGQHWLIHAVLGFQKGLILLHNYTHNHVSWITMSYTVILRHKTQL